MRVLEGHRGPVLCLAYSPDGSTLASGSWDKTVRLWCPATGKEHARATLASGAVVALAFSPDGKHLAVGTLGGVTLITFSAPTWSERPIPNAIGKRCETPARISTTTWGG